MPRAQETFEISFQYEKETKTNWKIIQMREQSQDRRQHKKLKTIINILRVKISEHETRTVWYKNENQKSKGSLKKKDREH